MISKPKIIPNCIKSHKLVNKLMALSSIDDIIDYILGTNPPSKDFSPGGLVENDQDGAVWMCIETNTSRGYKSSIVCLVLFYAPSSKYHKNILSIVEAKRLKNYVCYNNELDIDWIDVIKLPLKEVKDKLGRLLVYLRLHYENEFDDYKQLKHLI